MRRLSQQQQRQRLTVYLICMALAAFLLFSVAYTHPELSWFAVLCWFLGAFAAAIAAVMVWVMVWTWKNPD